MTPLVESEDVAAPFVSSKLSISVHQILSTAQQSHGLTHNDHQQYRSYLTNRISRLRHSRAVYKRKGSKKNNFHKREVTIDEANEHENFVLIDLYTAERAWVHAMELKTHAESDMKSQIGKRNYYIKRLKKSVIHVGSLEETATAVCDEKTNLELSCYGAWMRGNLFCEQRDYYSSCKQYAIALQTCHDLSEKCLRNNELQLSDFFLSRASNIIQPLLRYCQYELQQRKVTREEIDAIINVDIPGKEIEERGNKTILDENEDLQLSKIVTSMQVTFRGNNLSLDGATRVAFIKIQNKIDELAKLKNTNSHAKDAKFMEILNAYDDVASNVNKSLYVYKGMESGPAVNRKRFEFSSLLGYFQSQKLQLLMDRNERMAIQLRQGDKEMASLKGDFSGKNDEEDADAKYKRVEEIAHVYDALLQIARAVVVLPGGGDCDCEGERKDIEDEFVLEANANILRIRSLRCYYVGRMYAADAVAKYSESLALFQQASILSVEAAEEIAACEDMRNADFLIEEMVNLDIEINAALCRTKASTYLATIGSVASSATSSAPILCRLDDFDSGGRTYRLASKTLELKTIPCRPAFFDIGNNYMYCYPTSYDFESSIKSLERPQKNRIFRWF
mmetsp:Transcript_24006/g.36589  ORF Transcript_24006/g.36589 Transcript_24006/m.36589 type:complete len:620 (+) Transcript_24006:138-1997(+)